jgi:hypothetical protein
MSDQKSTGGGIGICTILFIVLLVLKLAEIGAVKDWSWWWVTSPLWIPLALFGAVAAMIIAFGVIAALIVGVKK